MEWILKKLIFITAKDKRHLDEHIQNNRFKNVVDNMNCAKSLGYITSRSAMYRYMGKLKVNTNGQHQIQSDIK